MQKIPVNLQVEGHNGQGSGAGPITFDTEGLKDIILDLHIESSGGLFTPVDYKAPLEWSTLESQSQRIMLDDSNYRFIELDSDRDRGWVDFRVYDDIGDTLTITGNLILVSDKVYGFMEDKSKVSVLRRADIITISGTAQAVPSKSAVSEQIDLSQIVYASQVAVLSVSQRSRDLVVSGYVHYYNSAITSGSRSYPHVERELDSDDYINVCVYNTGGSTANIDYKVVLLKL